MAGIPQEAGSAGGASGSVQFGQATSLRDQMRKATSGTQGPTGQPAQQGGGQAPAPAGGDNTGNPGAQPGAQPPPQQPGQEPFDVSKYTQFQQRTPPPPPWREQLKMWAAHPQANDAMRRLSLLANPEKNG